MVGCGALHLYGEHLAEIRSIAVQPAARGRGAGRLLVRALLREASRHRATCVCVFTRIPEFFAPFGFAVTHEVLPDKLYKDCRRCARRHACDEIAMIRGPLPQVGSVLGARAHSSTDRDRGRRIVSLHLPRGFLFASTTAGIKESGNPDVAYVEAPLGATATAMFTSNRVVAAPVTVGREHLRASRGRVRALLVNAGNANCATGPDGLAAARESCAALASLARVRRKRSDSLFDGDYWRSLPNAEIASRAPKFAG